MSLEWGWTRTTARVQVQSLSHCSPWQPIAPLARRPLPASAGVTCTGIRMMWDEQHNAQGLRSLSFPHQREAAFSEILPFSLLEEWAQPNVSPTALVARFGPPPCGRILPVCAGRRLGGLHRTILTFGTGYCLRTRRGVVWGPGQPRPTHPPIHIRKIFLRGKLKFIKGTGILRPI